jgi:hypothetical protein
VIEILPAHPGRVEACTAVPVQLLAIPAPLTGAKKAFFGAPILTGYTTPGSPHSLATVSAQRRQGTYLRNVTENTGPAR